MLFAIWRSPFEGAVWSLLINNGNYLDLFVLRGKSSYLLSPLTYLMVKMNPLNCKNYNAIYTSMHTYM